jgi:hypothetical protein
MPFCTVRCVPSRCSHTRLVAVHRHERAALPSRRWLGRRRRWHGSASYTRAVFFVFGLGTKQQDLGPGETRTCPRCHNNTQQSRVREFRQFSVFFVPVARWKRRVLEVCSICGTAVEV